MAVPAAMMSMTSPGAAFSAFIITCVSSHSERFRGVCVPLPKALIINALLLMLFDAGNTMVALIRSGGVILIFIFLIVCGVKMCKNNVFCKVEQIFFPVIQVPSLIARMRYALSHSLVAPFLHVCLSDKCVIYFRGAMNLNPSYLLCIQIRLK